MPACGSAHARSGHEKYTIGEPRPQKKRMYRQAKGCTKVFSSVIKMIRHYL